MTYTAYFKSYVLVRKHFCFDKFNAKNQALLVGESYWLKYICNQSYTKIVLYLINCKFLSLLRFT